jgi:hypothetical protein
MKRYRYPKPKVEWTGQSTIDNFFKLYSKVHPEKWVSFCLRFLGYKLKADQVDALPNELWMVPPSELPPKVSKKVLAALKRIPDALFKACVTKLLDLEILTEAEALEVIVHLEYQHRNEAGLPNRLLVYSGITRDAYPGYKVLQLVIYTGDEPFSDATEIDEDTLHLRSKAIDLTQIKPSDILDDPSIHIQILAIFNHQIGDEEKANRIFENLKEIYRTEGRSAFNFYSYLVISGTTKQNEHAMSLLKEKLAKDSPIYEELKNNPFYRAWLQEGKEIGVVEGKELGIVESALKLMRTMNLSADQAADALELDDAVRNEFYRRLNGKYRPD